MASALPLFGLRLCGLRHAEDVAGRGTPSRRSSKPFSAIGAPAVQVPVPLETSALLMRSRSSQA